MPAPHSPAPSGGGGSIPPALGKRAARRMPSLSLSGWIGAAMVALALLVAIFGPWIAPHPEGAIVTCSRRSAPICRSAPTTWDATC